MLWKSSSILISIVAFTISGNFALADCPPADLTGDCFVDFEDFALMAAHWLTTDPCVPDDMAYIPDGEFNMGDNFDEGDYDELPVHAVYLNSFFMSRYETTNGQYCDYLNSAIAQGLIEVRGEVVVSAPGGTKPYCDTHSHDADSQIDYNDVSETFSVRTKGGRDMSDDPMVEVSWNGAVAYCNWRSGQEGYQACYNLSTWECDFSKLGYRLPTEAEWEYAARGGEHNPYYRFPWGDTISHSQANYYSYWNGGVPVYSYDVNPTSGYHPAYNDGIFPYTSPVGSFSTNGYGLYDMAGNVWEWCNDRWSPTYYSTSPYDNPQGPASGRYPVLRGGAWISTASNCRIAARHYVGRPYWRFGYFGFRVVLDVPQLQASNPYPADGATGISIYANLTWAAGSDATSHDVFFGTNNPPPFICNQTSTTFDPGTMALETTFYWRVDEVNSSGKTTGQVWSFTTTSIAPPPPPPPPP